MCHSRLVTSIREGEWAHMLAFWPPREGYTTDVLYVCRFGRGSKQLDLTVTGSKSLDLAQADPTSSALISILLLDTNGSCELQMLLSLSLERRHESRLRTAIYFELRRISRVTRSAGTMPANHRYRIPGLVLAPCICGLPLLSRHNMDVISAPSRRWR